MLQVISIHHADAVDIMRALPDASIDAIVTDPPYSEHTHKNMRGNRGAAGIVTRDPGFAAMTSELRTLFSYEAVRVARSWIVVFSDWESIHLWKSTLEEAGGSYCRSIPWVRWSCPQFSGLAPPTGSEAVVVAKPKSRKALWLQGGRTHYADKCLRAQSRLEGGRKKHPTEKPVSLMRAILEDCTLEGASILDPFAGSGSTGVAALQSGRNAVLVEKDATTFAAMQERLAIVMSGQ